MAIMHNKIRVKVVEFVNSYALLTLAKCSLLSLFKALFAAFKNV